MDCTPEILVTSLLCPPVQYGITHAEDQGKSTWIPFALTYLLHSVGYQFLSLLALGTVAPPEVAAPAAACIGNICTGIYGGNARTTLRRKYGMDGSPLQDCLLHTFVSPCAIAQEASVVRKFHVSGYSCVPDTK